MEDRGGKNSEQAPTREYRPRGARVRRTIRAPPPPNLPETHALLSEPEHSVRAQALQVMGVWIGFRKYIIDYPCSYAHGAMTNAPMMVFIKHTP